MRLPHVLPRLAPDPGHDSATARRYLAQPQDDDPSDRAVQDAHAVRPGHGFTAEDYLALGSHPAIRRAALSGLGQHPQPDDPAPARMLDARLAAFLRLPRAFTFASGAEAIHHTLRQLLLPGDEVILDCAATPAMADAILAAGAHLHRTPAASVAGVERRLARLSRQPRRGRLVVVLPAISSQASRIADLGELTSLARTYGALLFVDATHDLGTIGPDGGGIAELHGCTGRIDVVFGSLAKTFAATGGFCALRDPDLATTLHSRLPQAKRLSPIGTNVIQAALDLVISAEGARRRRNLHGLVLRLRNHLMADGIKVMGQPSPFVPILLPPETALPRTALLESAGPRVTLLQAPTVPLHAPRWRIQLTAAHSPADIDDLAELLRDVTRAFDRVTVRRRVPA